MSSSNCLAFTGFNIVPFLIVGASLVLLGFLLLRSVKGRATLMAIALVGGGLALSQASVKPASAACPAPSAAPAATTTTTLPDPAPVTPLALGAAYLASSINASGYVQGSGGPDFGDTVQTAIALKATGNSDSDVSAAISRATSYLASNIDAYVNGASSPSPANDSASALAQLILVAHATGDPTLESDIPGLVTRLLATQSQIAGETGLFGASDPTYDGAIRQSLSLEALLVAGTSPSNAAVLDALAWLLAQQCSGGGFSTDVINNSCSGLPSNYEGPDTNSTGYALVALGALSQPSGPGSPVANALSYLSTSELSNAGWDYFGGGFDASSTSIVIEGLRATGQDPSSTTGSWSRSSVSPMASLVTLQVATSGTGQGGFLFQPSSPSPDIISSEQAVTALSGANLPL